MAKVYNWQLGREMDYRFDNGNPKWQFAAVFNTNRCIACQTCTMACKTTWTFSPGPGAHVVEQRRDQAVRRVPAALGRQGARPPGEGEPGRARFGTNRCRSRHVRPYGTFDGKTIFETADGADEDGHRATRRPRRSGRRRTSTRTRRPKFPKDGVQLPVHDGWFFYLQRICNHCTYPACLAACPRNAIYKRDEDGIVLIDQERCRGYRKCVDACPYKKSMYRPNTRTSREVHRLLPAGRGNGPADRGAADGDALHDRVHRQDPPPGSRQGRRRRRLWVEDPTNPLYYLVHVEKVALPLYPQFGTQPNVYYIPPRWVPRDYLKQMFGPGVDHAIERYSNPSRELLAVLQLFRASQTIVFSFKIEQGPKIQELTLNGVKREIYDDVVVGYDSQGREVVRVGVEEKVFERPQQFTMNTI